MQVLCEEGVSGTQKVEDKLKSVKTGEKCPRQRAAAGEKMEERRGRALEPRTLPQGLQVLFSEQLESYL